MKKIIITLSLLLSVNLFAEYNPTELVSLSTGGADGNGASSAGKISLSNDGRFVAFVSEASNLVSGDSNDVADIFLRDTVSETTTRVSLAGNDTYANGISSQPHLSSDGRYVVFTSEASNLATGDTNGKKDVFLRDTDSETTTLISIDQSGEPADGISDSPRISSDGRYVVFRSDATDLVAGDTNSKGDIFIRDTVSLTTTRVSVSDGEIESDGNSYSPDVSDNGNVIVFSSDATNLVAGDENAKTDIFVRDISDGTTILISKEVDSGEEGDNNSDSPRISANGNRVAFVSAATNLISDDTNEKKDIYLYQISSNQLGIISISTENFLGNADSLDPSISSDGSYVSFYSSATNMLDDEEDGNEVGDIFVRDIAGNKTTRITVKKNGDEITSASSEGVINSDAHYAVFTNIQQLLSNDDNEVNDIYRINLQCLVDAGITPEDQDVDGTDDCTDLCPLDIDKTSPGYCGCSVSEVDSDADLTPDCIDLCDDDPNKTNPGSCGCGGVDEDLNGNYVADCLDPTTETTPIDPKFFRIIHQKARLKIPQQFSQARYQMQVLQNGRVIKTKNTRRRSAIFTFAGSASARYRVLIPGSTNYSKFSAKIALVER